MNELQTNTTTDYEVQTTSRNVKQIKRTWDYLYSKGFQEKDGDFQGSSSMFFPKLKNTQYDPISSFNLQIGHEFMEIDTPIDDSNTNPHSIWCFGGLI